MLDDLLSLEDYDGIIFDMDGTLIDSMGAHMDAWQQVCDIFGYPFDPDFMHGLGGVPTRRTVELLNEKFGKAHCPDEIATKKRQLYEQSNFVPPLIDSTYRVFRHYRPSKSIGIGTGAERKNAEQILQHHGLLDEIDVLVTASDVSEGKPDSETFLKAAEAMDVEPGKCIVFEDTLIGLEAARRAGMDCVVVTAGQFSSESFYRR